MGLGDIVPIDPWDEPTRTEFEDVDADLLRELIQIHLPPINPLESPNQYGQVLDTARWFIAFSIDDWTERKRRWAQKQVAEDEAISIEAVQEKVRELYQDRVEPGNVQARFENDLKQIDGSYNDKERIC